MVIELTVTEAMSKSFFSKGFSKRTGGNKADRLANEEKECESFPPDANAEKEMTIIPSEGRIEVKRI